MATSLIIEYDDSDFSLNELRAYFPLMQAQTLGWIGSKGRSMLRHKLLSGQELDLRQHPKDRAGRGTTSYAIGKGAKYVKIRSYPVNLFEKGRRLRSGKKEAGRNIIGRKLKSMLSSSIQGIVNEFDRTILQKELDKRF